MKRYYTQHEADQQQYKTLLKQIQNKVSLKHNGIIQQIYKRDQLLDLPDLSFEQLYEIYQKINSQDIKDEIQLLINEIEQNNYKIDNTRMSTKEFMRLINEAQHDVFINKIYSDQDYSCLNNYQKLILYLNCLNPKYCFNIKQSIDKDFITQYNEQDNDLIKQEFGITFKDKKVKFRWFEEADNICQLLQKLSNQEGQIRLKVLILNKTFEIPFFVKCENQKIDQTNYKLWKKILTTNCGFEKIGDAEEQLKQKYKIPKLGYVQVRFQDGQFQQTHSNRPNKKQEDQKLWEAI